MIVLKLIFNVCFMHSWMDLLRQSYPLSYRGIEIDLMTHWGEFIVTVGWTYRQDGMDLWPQFGGLIDMVG